MLEIIANAASGTYRVVYTVKFYGIIYVLHCFQKKSMYGIKTPRQEIELIKSRLKIAEEDYKKNINKEENTK